MTTKDVKRKLTAILSADVQGYSRLMGDDERATVETITAYRKVMTDLIQENHGRVVDAKGDNVLAEFSSVVDAIQCAVEIQKELKVKNADLPEHRRMEFRIGVNLGDVIEKEDIIYGDGVNIAARLESLAEGGGICISGTAFDQVGKKLPLGYEFLGEQTVKNIEKPIRVYKVLVDPKAVGKVIGENRRLKVWHWTAIFGLAVLIIVGGVLALWEFYVRPDVAPASIEKMAYPLPAKPSIAVLPFDNMSKDPEQDYFCNGITEDIITALAKIPGLFVIARNSTFTYKGKPVKVQQVAEDLGVRYVLKGSVRKSKDRVRVTAQLIDAITGKHLWAEQYDRDLKDIFALQDEITLKILTELQVKLTEAEQARLLAKGTDNLGAYLKLLQGREHLYRFNKENNALARAMFQEAIALDPAYPNPYAFLGTTHLMDMWLGSSKSPRESLAKAIKYARKAIALDDSYANAHGLLGNLYIFTRQYDKGIAECERGVALDPNSADALGWLGQSLYWADRPEEVIPVLEKAIRLNPIPQSWYLYTLAMAFRDTGRYEEAISACKKVFHREPKNVIARLVLASTYSLSGREEEARAEAAEILRIDPKFSLERLAKTRPHKNQANTEQFIDSLRKAGLK
jgi:adenylate cyclase